MDEHIEASKHVKTAIDLFNFIEKVKNDGYGFTNLSLRQKDVGPTHNSLINICLDRDHVVIKSESGRITYVDRGTGSARWHEIDQDPDAIPPEQQIIQDRDELESLVHVLKKFEPIAEAYGTTVSGRTVELNSEGVLEFSNGDATEPSIYFLYQLIPTELDNNGKVKISSFDSEIEILSVTTTKKLKPSS